MDTLPRDQTASTITAPREGLRWRQQEFAIPSWLPLLNKHLRRTSTASRAMDARPTAKRTTLCRGFGDPTVSSNRAQKASFYSAICNIFKCTALVQLQIPTKPPHHFHDT